MNESRADLAGEEEIIAGPDPFALFAEWMAEAGKKEPRDANAMALATATPQGRPSVRMVLLKGFDGSGFVFYTNLESRKGTELAANPHAALCLHWKSIGRQIRIEGPVTGVSDAEADAYFASRARASRIGAWASDQSRPLAGRGEFLSRVAAATARYAVGSIPRPAHWSGFRLMPHRIEFWRDMPFRLHDRVTYDLRDGEWVSQRLFP